MTTISIDQFGKDHWSTFMYVEVRCVDHNGALVREHMRVDPDRHPHLAHRGSSRPAPPTRLRGDDARVGHDDYDCLDDLAAAGLLRSVGTGAAPRFVLTDDGWRAAGRLRRWRAEGGALAAFDATEAR